MRIVLSVLLVSLGVVAPSAAQEGPVQTPVIPDVRGPKELQPGFAPEPRIFTKTIDWVDREVNEGDGPKDGFYPEFGNMVTGSGWISAGPGYRHHLLGGRAIVDASAAVSWKIYKMAQARFEIPRFVNDRLSVGSQVIYQDMVQVNYFGIGNDSGKGNRSGFRLDETDVFGY